MALFSTQELTKPKVVTKLGAVIRPINKATAFKKEEGQELETQETAEKDRSKPRKRKKSKNKSVKE